jgi:hypothetical protein
MSQWQRRGREGGGGDVAGREGGDDDVLFYSRAFSEVPNYFSYCVRATWACSKAQW